MRRQIHITLDQRLYMLFAPLLAEPVFGRLQILALALQAELDRNASGAPSRPKKK